MPLERRIEDELLTAFAATDSLDAFRRLPLGEQEEFFKWIQKAPDEGSRWRRTDALVLAMRISCLRLEGHVELASDSVRNSRFAQASSFRSQEAAGLIKELKDPELLEILEQVIDEFLQARGESSVHETLAISQAFLIALREANCLGSFSQLPPSDQARFLRWIGSTRQSELRQKRTQTFIDALLVSPMSEPERQS